MPASRVSNSVKCVDPFSVLIYLPQLRRVGVAKRNPPIIFNHWRWVSPTLPAALKCQDKDLTPIVPLIDDVGFRSST